MKKTRAIYALTTLLLSFCLLVFAVYLVINGNWGYFFVFLMLASLSYLYSSIISGELLLEDTIDS